MVQLLPQLQYSHQFSRVNSYQYSNLFNNIKSLNYNQIFEAVAMIVEQSLNELQTWFGEYLDKSQPAIIDGVIPFSLDNLRSINPKCAQSIIQHPCSYYKIIKDWNKLRTSLHDSKKTSFVGKQPPVRISFEGHLGSNFVTPRGLNCTMANQLVGIQGIVTRISISRYQLQKSAHYCQKTNQMISKEYFDEYSLQAHVDLKKNKTIPTTDIHNNSLKFEFGRSTFKNFQTAVIQELPEVAPAGQLPRSVNVVIQDDLVDKIKPGDRVQLMGIYKLQPGLKAKQLGIIKAVLICTSIVPLYYQPNPLDSNKLSLKLPYDQNELLQIFSHSICPSVYGHQHLKKAVLLMLLGGVEKSLDNGAHLRGDINILMVGDPGTAKSQMLRWVLATVEIGVNTTGSGASGVGLTAAVSNDKDTGEKNIQAGAMVLADRGFVCIDQFDKMEETDRVAVHEVMEQQTVTIAKAGIHVSLNARCSVLAAANPIFGQYQRDLPPTKNIGMPDSLLSRFDLIFIILDEKQFEVDRKISERVCRNHRYAAIQVIAQNFVEENYIIQPIDIVSNKEDLMFEKGAIYKNQYKHETLTQSYLKKYLIHARNNIKPVLEDDSIKLSAMLWALLREKDFTQKEGNSKVLPITIRSYQTLIRLSTAHAKLRLSSVIELTDCVEAFKLMCFCLYKDEFALEKQLKECIKVVMQQFDLEIIEDNKKIRSKNQSVINKFGSLKSQANKIKSEPKSSHKYSSSVKKQPIVKKEESVLKKVQRIKINEEDQQLQRIMTANEEKQKMRKLNLTVFVTLTKLIKNKMDEKITFSELAEALPDIEEDQLRKCLRELDNSEKLLFDEERDNIHAV